MSHHRRSCPAKPPIYAIAKCIQTPSGVGHINLTNCEDLETLSEFVFREVSHENWPDFRRPASKPRRTKERWCHVCRSTATELNQRWRKPRLRCIQVEAASIGISLSLTAPPIAWCFDRASGHLSPSRGPLMMRTRLNESGVWRASSLSESYRGHGSRKNLLLACLLIIPRAMAANHMVKPTLSINFPELSSLHGFVEPFARPSFLKVGQAVNGSRHAFPFAAVDQTSRS